MKKTIITAVLSGMILLSAGLQTTAMADEAKAAKPATCKQQAKEKGLKDRKEIKAFVKECKAAAKKAHSTKK